MTSSECVENSSVKLYRYITEIIIQFHTYMKKINSTGEMSYKNLLQNIFISLFSLANILH